MFQRLRQSTPGSSAWRRKRVRRGRARTAPALWLERLEGRSLLATIVWGGGSGDWSNGSNWVGGQVPCAVDIAVINDSNVTVTHNTTASDSVGEVQFLGTGSMLSVSAGTLNISGNLDLSDGYYSQSGGTVAVTTAGVRTLTLSGGDFNDEFLATVSGPMTWSGGSIDGSGSLTANGGLALGGSAPSTSYAMTLRGVTLVNAGVAVMQQVTGGSFSTQLTLGAGLIPTTFDNKGSFDFQGDNTIIQGTTGIFINEDSLIKTVGATPLLPSVIGTAFNNIHTTNALGDSVDGTIEVDVGSLCLQGGGAFTSMALTPLTLAAGTSLDFQGGTFSVTAPLTVSGVTSVSTSGTGAVNFSGATVNFTGTNAVYSGDDTQISGGTFDYEAPTTASMGTLTISGANTRVVIGSNSTLSIEPLQGSFTQLTQTGGELDLNGGTIIAPIYNLSAGTFSGSGTIIGAVTNGGAFFPGGDGTTGTLTISDSLYNPGTYTQTATGSITFDVGGTAAGTQYSQLVATSNGTSTLSGMSNLNLINGYAPAVGDSFTLMTGVIAYDSSPYGNFLFSVPYLGADKDWQEYYRTTDMTVQVVAVGGFGVSLTPSNASPSYGQPESFTAVVTPTLVGPIPTGSVSFFVDGAPLGAAVTLQPASSGNATATSITTTIAAGAHTIGVDYSGDGNYAATSTSISLTVAQAHLSVVADDKTRAAGQPNPPLTASFVGFVNGEDATSAQITGAPTLTTTATAASPPGVYPISVVDAGTLSAPNYDFPASSFVNGMLTVLPASTANVVVGSTLPSSTYGQAVSFTAAVSGSGPVPTGTVQFLVDGATFGDPVMLVNGLATSLATTALGAGGHAIAALYSGDPSYGGNTGTATQQVAKANLTAVADDQSATRYAGLPPLTLSLTGFVNGEDATSAGVAVTADLSTTATAASPAGYYPILANVTSLVAANYQLGGVQDGTLTMKPAVMNVLVRLDSGLTVSLIGLGRDLPFFNIQTIKVVFSDNVDLSGATTQLLGINVPNYAISAPSYDPSTFTATWTLPAALGADRLTLNITGVTAPPVNGTGPNIVADPYSAAFAVLPGDVDGDGAVTIADAIDVRDDIQAFGGQYLIWADVDGSGIIDLTDLTAVRNRIGSVLPPA
jgi:hypothetical protein